MCFPSEFKGDRATECAQGGNAGIFRGSRVKETDEYGFEEVQSGGSCLLHEGWGTLLGHVHQIGGSIGLISVNWSAVWNRRCLYHAARVDSDVGQRRGAEAAGVSRPRSRTALPLAHAVFKRSSNGFFLSFLVLPCEPWAPVRPS